MTEQQREKRAALDARFWEIVERIERGDPDYVRHPAPHQQKTA